MSHQWTMEDFESIYSRFKSSGLSVMDLMYSSQTFLRVAFQAVAQRRLYPGKGKQ